MTRQEAVVKVQKLDVQIREAQRAIVVCAKGLVPVLRDAGREHSAKELDRLFFELDALTDEAKSFLETNMELILGFGPKS